MYATVAEKYASSDTLVCTLREEYGDHFAPGYRPTDKLGKVLKKEGVESLAGCRGAVQVKQQYANGTSVCDGRR